VADVILILEVVALVGVSAVCSGLNVAFMSLDVADLRRRAKLGNAAAQRMLPFRRNSHLTLAAILLTNVAAVSATSIVLGDKFYGLVAGFISTLLIVVFGEILPQALFSRRALAFCARLAPLLGLMIIVTYPISKPLQLLLDRLFPEQATRLQTRGELGMMIAEHLDNEASELDEDEVEIVRGALQFSEKRVRDITTPLRAVYWLTPDTKIDSAKIDEIKRNGWSRIPVFNERCTACFGVLLMKDLVDVSFDDEARRVDDLPLHPSQVVGSMTALDTLFRKFINGGAHLIPVERDDQIIGIVTIEDLLEEIVGHEIEDETDRAKRRSHKQH
jgi:metal transporter CNNM